MARFIDEFEAALKAGKLHDEIVQRACARELIHDFSLNEEREPFLILSDRGIRQALGKKVLKADVKSEDVQIQPSSLDCKVMDVDEDDLPAPLFGEFGRPKTMHEFGIPAYSAAEVLFTQHFKYEPRNFHPVVILRSSLGRAGIGPRTNAMNEIWSYEKKALKSGVRVANYSPNNIAFEPGDRFAQVLWGLLFKGYGYEDAPKYRRQVNKFLELVGTLESGIEVKDEMTLRDMADNGLYKINPILTLREGFVVLHASHEAFRFKEVETVNLNVKRTDLLEPVDISNGYTPKPGEHLLVKAIEHLKLSDKVGIHFLERPFNNLNGSEREMKLRAQVAATNLVNAAWFDPGYEGIYMAHIKNVDTLQTDIRPGDPIGFGVLFYFPKGVERPYGSQALQSHYQGAKTAQVLQNK